MSVLDPQTELRLRRLAETVHALGPAPMLHAMREIADGADISHVLGRFAALSADFVHAMGGDQFPDPVRVVAGGRS